MDEKIEKEDIYIDNERSLGVDDISGHESNQLFIKSPEERAFVRKLNWKLLPLVFLIVFIQVRYKFLNKSRSRIVSPQFH
jgi:hypothetical protein